jgi:asparagine synthase (glutamine-hydrolysing)
MCGINGKVLFSTPKTNTLSDDISKLNQCLSHRGPDDAGTFVDSNVGIGQTRLSILDLSSRGHQPMKDSPTTPSTVLTFNGEIYNFKALKKDLQDKHYTFFSNTDSEVLLKMYMEYGEHCLHYLNGMFAFVIFDKKHNTLFGARDRFGQKPLKYYIDDEQFIFSSELKAILSQDIKRDIDKQAIYDFLSLQYVPSPRTGVMNIWKLPPAHYFTLDINTQTCSVHRYYDVSFQTDHTKNTSTWKSEITTQLDQAVKRRLIADVPLGAFLSGGVDSSAIVAMASRHTKNLQTFSIAFQEADYDESSYAQQIANKYNTSHTEFHVSASELPQYVEHLAYQFEEPFADPSQLPTFILSQLTRTKVKVALSGDGGDENFGGYKKYQKHLLYEKFASLCGLLYPIKSLFPANLQRDLNLLPYSPARRHYNFTNYFTEFQKKDFLNEEFLNTVETSSNIFEEALQNKHFSSTLNQIYYLDLNFYMSQGINTKVDISSMNHALEVRAPMLDVNFVDMTSRIPHYFKTSLRDTKSIFKETLESFLPNSILYRKKQGFGVPLKQWFRNDLHEYTDNIILAPQGLVLQIFKQNHIQKLLRDHHKGKADNSKKIWMLLMLNLWYKTYFSET